MRRSLARWARVLRLDAGNRGAGGCQERARGRSRGLGDTGRPKSGPR